MSGSKKKTPAEELIESLLKDVGGDASSLEASESDDPVNILDPQTSTNIEGLVIPDDPEDQGFKAFNFDNDYVEETENEFEGSRHTQYKDPTLEKMSMDGDTELRQALGALKPKQQRKAISTDDILNNINMPPEPTVAMESMVKPSEKEDLNAKTQLINFDAPGQNTQQTQAIQATVPSTQFTSGDSDKTVAVAGYQVRGNEDYGDKVKVTVGQNRASSGYSAWNSGGSADSNLAQAENLRIAQEKIIELEQENEKLRQQNEELMAASEIIKERSDLLSQQISEYKNDRDDLESSFKNEIVLLKNHLARKDAELQKTQMKTEELDSRLKFDMKKIRVRERELENRLELIRAEKNAIVKNKDEQILDLRRKMDVLQMEVESYRQKCVELNKSIESSQESFKRTTRALRLAMANLELQEENKAALKKVD